MRTKTTTNDTVYFKSDNVRPKTLTFESISMFSQNFISFVDITLNVYVLNMIANIKLQCSFYLRNNVDNTI